MNKIMIKVGAKEFPCRLTMGAMLQFKRTVGKDVSQMNWEDMEELLAPAEPITLNSPLTSRCSAT